MSTSIDKLAKEFKNMMTASDDRKPKPYDTQAEVLRVENDIAWVHIPGGVEETPVRLTMNAKKGDMVNIHVASGSAWITGNSTNPPTDDAEALVAKSIAIVADDKSEEALSDAGRAKAAADAAEGLAEDALTSAAQAADSATRADLSAKEAGDSAVSASQSASQANYHLSEIENVVGALTWIADHGTYKKTSDTSIIPGKWYFQKIVSSYELTSDTSVINGKEYYTRSGEGTEQSPYVYTEVSDPSGNPHDLGYYEENIVSYVVSTPASNPYQEGLYELESVDSAVSNYLSTHLYFDGTALNVQLADNSSKLRLAGDGIYLIDANGKDIARYKDTIILGDYYGSHIELSPTYGLGFYNEVRQEDNGVPINRVAYIDSGQLYINKATLTSSLQIGNFEWVVLTNRISLRYNPIN